MREREGGRVRVRMRVRESEKGEKRNGEEW